MKGPFFRGFSHLAGIDIKEFLIKVTK
jgi:hypothetical protein